MRGLGRQFGLAGYVRPEYPPQGTPNVLPNRVSLPTLSQEVASRLAVQFPQAICRHNSRPVYARLEDLSALRVDCWPQGLERVRKNAAAFNRFSTIAIAIQQHVDRQDIMDLATNLADDVLDSMIHSGRWCGGKLYCLDGSFVSTDVFDRLRKYEENVFQAILSVRFRDFV